MTDRTSVSAVAFSVLATCVTMFGVLQGGAVSAQDMQEGRSKSIHIIGWDDLRYVAWLTEADKRAGPRWIVKDENGKIYEPTEYLGFKAPDKTDWRVKVRCEETASGLQCSFEQERRNHKDNQKLDELAFLDWEHKEWAVALEPISPPFPKAPFFANLRHHK
jgi:hypothetical protein